MEFFLRGWRGKTQQRCLVRLSVCLFTDRIPHNNGRGVGGEKESVAWVRASLLGSLCAHFGEQCMLCVWGRFAVATFRGSA